MWLSGWVRIRRIVAQMLGHERVGLTPMGVTLLCGRDAVTGC